MNCRICLVYVAVLSFFTCRVNAQHMPGNVIIHSDPRLASLLQKNPTAAPPISSVSHTEPVSKKNRNTPKTPAPVVASLHSATREPGHPVAAAIPVHATPETPPSHPVVIPASHTPAVALSHKDGRVLYTGKGYRVQIYNGSDREKAIKIKTDFMRLFPGMHTYLTYAAPCFRVKVGDYRNRAEAEGMLRETNSMYDSPTMIVPDMVTVHANN